MKRHVHSSGVWLISVVLLGSCFNPKEKDTDGLAGEVDAGKRVAIDAAMPDAALPDAAPPDAVPIECTGNPDCQEPPSLCLQPGTCNLETNTCEYEPVDCSESGDDCNAGTCDEETGECVSVAANEGASCGAVETCGNFGPCTGFADTCSTAGTKRRECITYSCQSGACVGQAAVDSETCMRPTDGESCGGSTVTGCASCTGFDDRCDETGTQSCTCTDYVCQGGTCQETASSCAQPCERDTENVSCRAGEVTDCGPCTASTTCGEAGTKQCTCTAYSCSDGVCSASRSSCTQRCSRDTDGDDCGRTTYSSCSECSYASTCAEVGTESCTCTDYECSGGSCRSSTRKCSRSCGRRRTDGKVCGRRQTCRAGICIGGGLPLP